MMAIADYDRAVQLDSTDPSALLNRGMFLFVDGQKEEALLDFEASLHVDAHNPYAAIWRYIAQASLGTQDTAKSELQKFVASQKETPGRSPSRRCWSDKRRRRIS